MAAKKGKAPSTKRVDATHAPWSAPDDDWKVVFGLLRPNPGRPSLVKPIFKVVGEKIPKGALRHVERILSNKGIEPEGVYFAHDSMGCARYAGRGQIFGRLRQHFRDHPHELTYFSFYIIADKKHEREVETALIRIASHLLVFNLRKKRDDIEPGSVADYEPSTYFFERQRKKGPKAKKTSP